MKKYVKNKYNFFKNTWFSNSSKSVKSRPKSIWSSGKNSYRVFWPESRKPKKIIKSIFLQLKFSCQVALFKGFQKVEKSDFWLYLSKKRTYGQMDRCKKNLWSMWILTWNIFEIRLFFMKISQIEIGSFFFDLTVPLSGVCDL